MTSSGNFPEFIIAKIYPTAISIRLLTDSGCLIAAVTQKLVNELKLPVQKSKVRYHISGITEGELISCEIAIIKLQLKGMKVFQVEAVVLPCEDVWTAVVPEIQPPWLSDMVPFLADPDIFYSRGKPPSYQLILGRDYMALFKLCPFYFDETFALVESPSGLIPRGRVTSPCTTVPSISRIRISTLQAKVKMTDKSETTSDDELNKLISEYLDMEKFQFFGPPDVERKEKVEDALQAYIKTLKRAEDGRIIAILPKVANYKQLISENLLTGSRRIKSVEKLLERNDHVSRAYQGMKDNWERDGVIVKTTLEELRVNGPFTELPHHGVIKMDSLSTPVRMVIAGDAKDPGKYSTNDFF